jgi:hypothetical protein
MAAVIASFPFPAHNPSYTRLEDVIFVPGHEKGMDQAIYRVLFERAQSDEARLLRLQYLGVEEELERAFRYVSPSSENANAFSMKFAEVIRAAANAYEILCRTLYARFYNDRDSINIFNYLALDRFLGLSDKRVAHLMAFSSLAQLPEVSQPFCKLSPWDKNSPVAAGHVPDWWSGYNGIKHTNAGLQQHATLANATAATAALFLLIEAIFGCGILNGGMVQAPMDGSTWISFVPTPRWSRLFAKVK